MEEYARIAARGEWFTDARTRFLGGADPAEAFRATIDDLVRKGAVTLRDGRLSTGARN